MRRRESAGEQVARGRWPRQWSAIVTRLNAVIHGAPASSMRVVCNDGFSMRVVFDKEAERARRPIERLTVIVPPDSPDAADLRDRWREDARNPARGLFHKVHTADLVELVWRHGGVDLAASREATRTEDME